ncbi:MAG TPA: DUF4383 domain-containing protein [Gemmatimonadaceae bacterium]|nr:DUF4383 domain-containing protein [Gemmatimonadaceae bacterium]
MTLAQRFAQIAGWLFVLVGAAGFVVTGGSMHADPATAPKLLGFPLNALHNVVHLLVGVWGIVASRTHDGARGYLLGAGVAYLALAVGGYFVPNGFGLVPIGGSDVGLHAVFAVALLGGYFMARGAAAVAAPPRTTATP